MLLCGMLACITMGTVILLVIMIVKKVIAVIGAEIAITYSLLWLETNFGERLPLTCMDICLCRIIQKISIIIKTGTMTGTVPA